MVCTVAANAKTGPGGRPWATRTCDSVGPAATGMARRVPSARDGNSMRNNSGDPKGTQGILQKRITRPAVRS